LRAGKIDRSLLQGECFDLFAAAIRSPATRDPYERKLLGFLKRVNLSPDGLVQFAKENPSAADHFKRGNYSLFRLLVIVNAAGSRGIPTRKLLDEIPSHDTYTQRVLDRAQKQGLIERVKGDPPGAGQFSPVYNIITERGKQLLRNHHLDY
jgi:hypothetical protein